MIEEPPDVLIFRDPSIGHPIHRRQAQIGAPGHQDTTYDNCCKCGDAYLDGASAQRSAEEVTQRAGYHC